MKKDIPRKKQPDSQEFYCVNCKLDFDNSQQIKSHLKEIHKVPNNIPVKKEMQTHIDGTDYFMGSDKYTIKINDEEIIFIGSYYMNRKKDDPMRHY